MKEEAKAPEAEQAEKKEIVFLSDEAAQVMGQMANEVEELMQKYAEKGMPAFLLNSVLQTVWSRNELVLHEQALSRSTLKDLIDTLKGD